MADTVMGNPPNNTVYVRNLEERIKLPELIPALREAFEPAGDILDIIAKKNLKAKGQAFIVFDNAEVAQDAIDTFQDFELFGKPMKLDFAKSRSDTTVQRDEGEEGLDKHKRQRLAEKERKRAIEDQKESNKRSAATAGLANGPAGAAKKLQANTIQEDEYLPPNKIILLRDVDESYGKAELTTLFSQFPGFKEVRMVPTRKGIAFVEYNSQDGAISAKAELSGKPLGEKTLRITYQKQ